MVLKRGNPLLVSGVGGYYLRLQRKSLGLLEEREQ